MAYTGVLVLAAKATADTLDASGLVCTSTAQSTTTIAGATLVPPTDARLRFKEAGGYAYGVGFPLTTVYAPNSRYNGAWDTPAVACVEFTLTGTQCEFMIYAANITIAALRVKVDGKRVTDLPQLFSSFAGVTAGGRFVYKLVFPTSAARKITLETTYGPIGGVFVNAATGVVTASAAPAVRAIFQGDSITGSSSNNTGGSAGTYVTRVADYLGIGDPWNVAIGGTGFVNAGSSVVLQTRLADTTSWAPNVVVVWAGYNDDLLDQPTVQTAATTYLNNTKSALPSAEIYMFGCYAQMFPASGLFTTQDATLKAAAAAAAVPFVSPLTGNCYNAAGVLLGNVGALYRSSADITAYVGVDGVHPNDAGHVRIASWMRDAFGVLLGTNLGGAASLTGIGTTAATGSVAVTAAAGAAPPVGFIGRWVADDLVGADSSAVTSWVDQATGKTADQATTTAQPKLRTGTNGLNGHNTVQFDGATDFLALSGAALGMAQNKSTLAVFVCYRLPVAAQTGIRTLFALSHGTAAGSVRAGLTMNSGTNKPQIAGRRLDTDAYASRDSGLAAPVTNHTGVLTGVWHWSTASVYLYDDGTTAGTSTTFQTAGATSNTVSLSGSIGANSSGAAEQFAGDIAEILVYPDADPVTRAAVHNYLAGQYGVVLTTRAVRSGAGMPSVGGVNRVANGDFGIWRGAPATVASTWQDATYSAAATGSTHLVTGGTYVNWTQDLDQTCGGLWSTANGGNTLAADNSWANAATGSMDAKWTAVLNNLVTKWGARAGTLYLGFCHEMNATWFDWQVRPAEVANFITAWRRFYALKQTIFPAAKVAFRVIGATNGQAYDWRALWPGDAYVDVFSVDWYADTYKNVITNGGSGFDGYGAPRGLPEHLAFAESHGKAMTIPEWGVDPVYGNGDDPAYIQYVHDFAVANQGTGPGQVLHESYFNESKSATDRRQIYYVAGEPDANGRTTTEFPLATAKYIALYSGVTATPMPTADIVDATIGVTWTHFYGEDFLTNVALGGFTTMSTGGDLGLLNPASAGGTAYAASWKAKQEASLDTDGHAQHSAARTMSVSGSVLDVWLHTEGGVAYGSAIKPLLPGPFTTPGRRDANFMTYGRVAWRARCTGLIPDTVSGFTRYGHAGLFVNNAQWVQGVEGWSEIDYTETRFDANAVVGGFYHPTHPIGTADTSDPITSAKLMTDWHNNVIEWFPVAGGGARLRCWSDGALLYDRTNRVAVSPMYLGWLIQMASNGGTPVAAAEAHYQIDWISMWSAVATAGGGQATGAVGWSGTAVGVISGVSVSPWLSFEMPSAAALSPATTGRYYLSHPVDSYYVSPDNAADGTADYWERNWVYDPTTPGAAQNAAGGFVRERYARRPKRPEADGVWQVKDYRWEVAAARHAGLDAFTYGVSQRSPSTMWSGRFQRACAAAVLENAAYPTLPKFHIIPWILSNTSVTGPSTITLSTADITAAANYLADDLTVMIAGATSATYGDAFLKIGGKTVVMAYAPNRAPNNKGPTSPGPGEASGHMWWRLFRDRMAANGTPCLLWMELQDSLTAWAPVFEDISDAIGQFGSRDYAASESTTSSSYGNARFNLQVTLGLKSEAGTTPIKFIAPVSTQGNYARGNTDLSGSYGYIWEAQGTRNLVATLGNGTVNQSGGVGSEIMMANTWNDFAEGAQIMPTLQSKWHWIDLIQYWHVKHKTGAFPTIVRDGLYLTHRKQKTTGNAAGGGATYTGLQTKFVALYHDPATGHTPYNTDSPLVNVVDVVTFLTTAGTVAVTTGGVELAEVACPAGFNRFTVPMGLGAVSARLIRSSATVLTVVSPITVSAIQVVEDLTYYGCSNFSSVARPVPIVPGDSVTPIPPVADPSVLTLVDQAMADTLFTAVTTTATAQTTSTIAGATLVPPTDGRFLYRGGGGYAYGVGSPLTTMYAPNNRYSYPWSSPPGASVEFLLTGTQCELFLYAANITVAALRIKIDGKRVTDIPVQFLSFTGVTAGGRFAYKLVFATSATRRITYESAYGPFGGVWVDGATGVITQPAPVAVRAIFQGDSITGSSSQNTGGAIGTYVNRVSDYLGIGDPWNVALGSTGFIAPGTTVVFHDRLIDTTGPAWAPNVVFIWGGVNDALLDMTAFTAAVNLYLGDTRAALPNAEIYLIGCYAYNYPASGPHTTVDGLQRTAAAAATVPFLSPITGNCYNAAGTLVGNVGPLYRNAADITAFVGADGVHPTNAGHERIARWMRDAFGVLLVAPVAQANIGDAAGEVAWAASVSGAIPINTATLATASSATTGVITTPPIHAGAGGMLFLCYASGAQTFTLTGTLGWVQVGTSVSFSGYTSALFKLANMQPTDGGVPTTIALSGAGAKIAAIILCDDNLDQTDFVGARFASATHSIASTSHASPSVLSDRNLCKTYVFDAPARGNSIPQVAVFTPPAGFFTDMTVLTSAASGSTAIAVAHDNTVVNSGGTVAPAAWVNDQSSVNSTWTVVVAMQTTGGAGVGGVGWAGSATGPAVTKLTIRSVAAADTLFAPAPAITLTQQTATTIAGASLINPLDSRIHYRGAAGVALGVTPSASFVAPNSRSAYGWDSPPSWGFEFMHTGTTFELLVQRISSSFVRLKVDGQRVTDLPVTTVPIGGGATFCYKVVFTGSATRRITVEGAYLPMRGIYVNPATDSIGAPPPFGTRMIVHGDNLSVGTSENTGWGAGSWVQRFADYATVGDPWNVSISGNNGFLTGTTMLSVITDVTNWAPDVVIVWSGYADRTSGSQAPLTTAVDTYLASLRATLPAAEVYVVGSWCPTITPGPTQTLTDASMKGCAQTAGMPFLSPVTGNVYSASGVLLGSTGPWLATAADVTACVGSDAITPTDAGQARIAVMMRAGLLLAVPAGNAVGTGTGAVIWAGSVTGAVPGRVGTGAGAFTFPGAVVGASTRAGTGAGAVMWTGAVVGTAPGVNNGAGFLTGAVRWVVFGTGRQGLGPYPVETPPPPVVASPQWFPPPQLVRPGVHRVLDITVATRAWHRVSFTSTSVGAEQACRAERTPFTGVELVVAVLELPSGSLAAMLAPCQQIELVTALTRRGAVLVNSAGRVGVVVGRRQVVQPAGRRYALCPAVSGAWVSGWSPDTLISTIG